MIQKLVTGNWQERDPKTTYTFHVYTLVKEGMAP